jgi:MinD-like ATPase involved in chromosome partitioning or flagellar assembly
MGIQAVSPQKATRVFAMASDEGEMGKTSVVANLAFALTKLQKTVLVMDTSSGLRNLNILLCSTPQYRAVESVFQKWHRAAQQLLEVVGHRDLLPGGIPRDIHVPRALRQRKTVVDTYPNAQTSRACLH